MVCTKPYEWCDVCNPETSGGSLLADWVKTFLSLHYFGLYCSQYLRIDLHYAAKNILALLLSDFLLCTLICLNLAKSVRWAVISNKRCQKECNTKHIKVENSVSWKVIMNLFFYLLFCTTMKLACVTTSNLIAAAIQSTVR